MDKELEKKGGAIFLRAVELEEDQRGEWIVEACGDDNRRRKRGNRLMAAHNEPGSDTLLNKGFSSLILAQFFGAVNDNLLKQVLTFAVAIGGIWASRLGDGGQAFVGLCLTIPFIILSGFAGQIADRTSKSGITVWVKVAEIGIALIGFAAFYFGHIWTALSAMLLLGIQSSFFGPAKYGMIPELVGSRHLSQANGSINMFTNIAVIAGTVIAGFIYAWYDPSSSTPESKASLPAALLWAPGVGFLIVAVLGLLSALTIPKLPAIDPDRKIDYNPFRIYVNTIREMAQSSLLLVALAWSFFYLIAWLALLILPDYRELLGISPQKTTILLGILGVAIGIGSVLAGLISGKHIEPRLIPVGAVGMTVCFLLLGSIPLHFGLVATTLTATGVFAGFYIVPLQALLQHLSPPDERGQFLGTANALSFVFGTIGLVLFRVLRSSFQIPSNRIFLVAAALSIIGTGILLWRLRKLLVDPTLRRSEAT